MALKKAKGTLILSDGVAFFRAGPAPNSAAAAVGVVRIGLAPASRCFCAVTPPLTSGEWTDCTAKLRFKRLDLRFLEIGVLCVMFTKRDPGFPGISGQVD
eukprot:sb/3478661/